MNIGEAARLADLPSKTIRYYEEVGLVRPSCRRSNNYRDYSDEDVHRLAFVARARGLGFTLDECRELLDLYADTTRTSAQVKALALKRIGEIEARIRDLQAMRAALAELARRCQGDDRPTCPILDEIAGQKVMAEAAR